jgi:hypothetical protein
MDYMNPPNVQPQTFASKMNDDDLENVSIGAGDLPPAAFPSPNMNGNDMQSPF